MGTFASYLQLLFDPLRPERRVYHSPLPPLEALRRVQFVTAAPNNNVFSVFFGPLQTAIFEGVVDADAGTFLVNKTDEYRQKFVFVAGVVEKVVGTGAVSASGKVQEATRISLMYETRNSTRRLISILLVILLCVGIVGLFESKNISFNAFSTFFLAAFIWVMNAWRFRSQSRQASDFLITRLQLTKEK